MFKTMMGTLDPNKKPSEDEIEKISPFQFCRWLSGSPGTILAANQINYYYNIPMVNQYHMIKNAFAGKVKYVPYPKSHKDVVSKEIEYLQRHFNISNEKAREYMELIDKQELKDIIDMYTEYDMKHGVK